MINRIKTLFASGVAAQALPRADELQLATAALLVEAAMMDGAFDPGERARISRLLAERFALNAEEVATVIEEAEAAVQHTGQLYGFTRVLKDRYDPAERIRMIEMLWEVAFADGDVDHFESNLIGRVGGLLFVTDRDRGLAKQRVMAKLGSKAP
ncbi:MAG TPA: TerB family tellurite resistance protein [Gammaproteobacteria bacterium]|nr:TerB family tellurite resistance protein [Gammaproteobacteria bacterium]